MSSITRRAVLRGLGTSIALPFLPSLSASAASDTSRFVVFFVPNGIAPALWVPPGDSGSSNSVLDALGDVSELVDVFSGLDNAPAWWSDFEQHSGNTRALLTSSMPDEVDPLLSKTLDQRIADHVGQDSVWRSLALGSEVQPACRLLNCDMLAHISWRSSTLPVSKEVDVQSLFTRVFGDSNGSAARRVRRRSVLDTVLEDAKRFRARAGTEDQLRLDGYIHGIREVELRLERASLAPECDVSVEIEGKPTGDDHIELMLDLMTLALQCDQTRVITYMLSNAQSRRDLGFLGFPVAHHDLSHTAEWVEAHAAVARWELGHYAGLIRRLRDTPTAKGSLLDDTYVLFLSSMGDGNAHAPYQLPVMLSGKGLGGTHHVLPSGTPIANLYLSLLHAFGVEATSYGMDSTGSLLDLV